MFNIGDLVFYSREGICRVDDVCEKNITGVKKIYYVLHPMEECKLKISIPIDNEKVLMLQILNRQEAEEILESFKTYGIGWIEENKERSQVYSEIVKKGNRKEISMIVNTMMREKSMVELNGGKLYEKDKKFLDTIQSMLFRELALVLERTFETINEVVLKYIRESQQINLDMRIL